MNTQSPVQLFTALLSVLSPLLLGVSWVTRILLMLLWRVSRLPRLLLLLWGVAVLGVRVESLRHRGRCVAVRGVGGAVAGHGPIGSGLDWVRRLATCLLT